VLIVLSLESAISVKKIRGHAEETLGFLFQQHEKVGRDFVPLDQVGFAASNSLVLEQEADTPLFDSLALAVTVIKVLKSQIIIVDLSRFHTTTTKVSTTDLATALQK